MTRTYINISSASPTQHTQTSIFPTHLHLQCRSPALHQSHRQGATLEHLLHPPPWPPCAFVGKWSLERKLSFLTLLLQALLVLLLHLISHVWHGVNVFHWSRSFLNVTALVVLLLHFSRFVRLSIIIYKSSGYINS